MDQIKTNRHLIAEIGENAGLSDKELGRFQLAVIDTLNQKAEAGVNLDELDQSLPEFFNKEVFEDPRVKKELYDAEIAALNIGMTDAGKIEPSVLSMEEATRLINREEVEDRLHEFEATQNVRVSRRFEAALGADVYATLQDQDQLTTERPEQSENDWSRGADVHSFVNKDAAEDVLNTVSVPDQSGWSISTMNESIDDRLNTLQGTISENNPQHQARPSITSTMTDKYEEMNSSNGRRLI